MAEAPAPIEIRLGTVAQLFNTLDPSPFREGDLAAEAEAYIVEWASELPPRQPLAIVVHLPEAELATPQAQRIPASIGGYFAARAVAEGRAIRANLRDGRTALVIGLLILAACLLLAWRAETGLREGTFSRVVQESLVILGWVAIWRPAEIFLYDWLPHARARRLFRRLAAAPVTLRGA